MSADHFIRVALTLEQYTNHDTVCSYSQSFVDHLISFLSLLCFRARLFIDALWSPAGKWLTSWLSFVMSYCEVITFPLVSLVRRGA